MRNKGLDRLGNRASRWEQLQHRLNERNLVMGVLNVTPDSFSDGGRFLDPPKAIIRAMDMMRQGADLIDVGGESTRPGAEPVSVEAELERVLPVIKAIREESAIPISIDTTKLEVAAKALEMGADLVNDISAGLHSPGLFELVAEAQAGMILMHMRGTPRDMQQNTEYEDVVAETRDFLRARTSMAVQVGVRQDRVWIDPGIGFGKSVEGNLRILANLEDYRPLGYPVVVGVSRKSFIGKILDRPADERLFGGLGLIGALAGDGDHRIYRVHDVGPSVDCLRGVEAMNRNRKK